MAGTMSRSDKAELERRRLTEQVSNSVEATLRWRYTWIAIVIGTLIGGGSFSILILMEATARKKIIEIEMLLDNGKNSLEEFKRLSADVKERYAELDKISSESFEGRSTLRNRVKETADALNNLKKEVNVLRNDLDIKTVNQESKKEGDLIKRIERGRYTIYIHIGNENDRVKAKKLRTDLQENGYAVPGIQNVGYKLDIRQVRYFYDQDSKQAAILKEDLDKSTSIENEKVKFITKFVPGYENKAPKGLLEIWLF